MPPSIPVLFVLTMALGGCLSPATPPDPPPATPEVREFSATVPLTVSQMAWDPDGDGRPGWRWITPERNCVFFFDDQEVRLLGGRATVTWDPQKAGAPKELQLVFQDRSASGRNRTWHTENVTGPPPLEMSIPPVPYPPEDHRILFARIPFGHDPVVDQKVNLRLEIRYTAPQPYELIHGECR